MIYLLALALSLALCVQMVMVEGTSGNIQHLKNGREPNAGVALVPLVPGAQILLLGLAWLLNKFLPAYALAALAVVYGLFSVAWLVSYRRLSHEFNALKKTRHTP